MKKLILATVSFAFYVLISTTPESVIVQAKSISIDGYARITNVQAVRNYASIEVDGKVYKVEYNQSLNIYCNEKSPSGNFYKTIYLDKHGDGVFSRARYVFKGYNYSIWLDSNGNWEISQAS